MKTVAFLTFIVSSAAFAEPEIPWSFAPIERPDIPKTQQAELALDDLDHFVLKPIEAKNIAPNSIADRRTLIRRAAFDLTGLPPTLDEVESFLNDPADDQTAFAKVVDGYLASDRFGERWGRHWLDVARYGDSIGRVINATFVYAWRYRDWVIDSMNADKPFDRFITEQIAGDLMPADSIEQRREQITATGLLALSSLNVRLGHIEPFTLEQIDEQIDVVTRGFLGLSIACARCHDHKYDPVSQVDYYALAGIFWSSKALTGVPHRSEQGGHGYVSPTALLQLPTSLDEPLDRVQDIPPGMHSTRQATKNGGFGAPVFDIMPNAAMGVREGKLADCPLREGGMIRARGVTPPRGDIRIPQLPKFPEVPNDTSGWLQLAEWITNPDHPLTARVQVNRIWLHLFGRGLVETVDNFGVTGSEPSHPHLLDHLSTRFVEDGWSVKRMIRAIMLSRTYQLSGEDRPDGLQNDADNLLYWRANQRRLELEPLRDTLLFLGGKLDLNRPEPGVLASVGGGSGVHTRSEIDFDSPYRTVYLPVLRDLLPEEYGLFDFPDPSTVIGKRHVTTAPPQALFFMNSEFVERAAYNIADLLIETEITDTARVDLAYQIILGRPPAAAERNAAFRLISDLDTKGLNDPETYRLVVLIEALFQSAEFRYVL